METLYLTLNITWVLHQTKNIFYKWKLDFYRGFGKVQNILRPNDVDHDIPTSMILF